MVLVVTGVGSLIHVYSVGYMSHDPSYRRFFLYLNLFMFAMLMLRARGQLPCSCSWLGGVGLCSYLLIGFWTERPSRPRRARRRSSSTGSATRLHARRAVLIAGPLARLRARVRGGAARVRAGGAIVTPRRCCCSSGPQARAPDPALRLAARRDGGPDPVSALIHAATMVTAGVYLLARSHVLFELRPHARGRGGDRRATALMAATSAWRERHQARARVTRR